MNLGFLSQNVPKLCLRHLKVFTNRFYGFEGCQENRRNSMSSFSFSDNYKVSARRTEWENNQM